MFNSCRVTVLYFNTFVFCQPLYFSADADTRRVTATGELRVRFNIEEAIGDEQLTEKTFLSPQRGEDSKRRLSSI